MPDPQRRRNEARATREATGSGPRPRPPLVIYDPNRGLVQEIRAWADENGIPLSRAAADYMREYGYDELPDAVVTALVPMPEDRDAFARETRQHLASAQDAEQRASDQDFVRRVRERTTGGQETADAIANVLAEDGRDAPPVAALDLLGDPTSEGRARAYQQVRRSVETPMAASAARSEELRQQQATATTVKESDQALAQQFLLNPPAGPSHATPPPPVRQSQAPTAEQVAASVDARFGAPPAPMSGGAAVPGEFLQSTDQPMMTGPEGLPVSAPPPQTNPAAQPVPAPTPTARGNRQPVVLPHGAPMVPGQVDPLAPQNTAAVPGVADPLAGVPGQPGAVPADQGQVPLSPEEQIYQSYQRSAQRENDYGGQVADVLMRQQQMAQQALQAQQAQLEQMAQEQERYLRESTQALQDLYDTKFDANDLFNGSAGLGGFSAALGVAVGQMLATTQNIMYPGTNATNVAARMVNDAIERNIATQRENFQRGQARLNAMSSLHDRARRAGLDNMQALDFIRAKQMETAGLELQAMADRHAGTQQGEEMARLADMFLLQRQDIAAQQYMRMMQMAAQQARGRGAGGAQATPMSSIYPGFRVSDPELYQRQIDDNPATTGEIRNRLYGLATANASIQSVVNDIVSVMDSDNPGLLERAFGAGGPANFINQRLTDLKLLVKDATNSGAYDAGLEELLRTLVPQHGAFSWTDTSRHTLQSFANLWSQRTRRAMEPFGLEPIRPGEGTVSQEELLFGETRAQTGSGITQAAEEQARTHGFNVQTGRLGGSYR